MWNPFSRKPESTGRSPASAAVADPRSLPPGSPEAAEPAPVRERSPIADIQIMGEVAVATLTVTELSQDAGAERLAELLLELAETGAEHFILDVQNVQFMDTTCLGCLVEALNRLAVSGGQIALASPNHSVSYVFKLTRLDRVFRICPDAMAAMRALAA